MDNNNLTPSFRDDVYSVVLCRNVLQLEQLKLPNSSHLNTLDLYIGTMMPYNNHGIQRALFRQRANNVL